LALRRPMASQRLNVILLWVPGIDDETDRLPYEYGPRLDEFFTTALDTGRIKDVELLVISTHETLLYVIDPVPTSDYGDDDSETVQANLQVDQQDDPTPIGTVESLAKELKAHLDERVGIGIGAVDLGPIGRGPVIGTRALLEKNREMTKPSNTTVLLCERLIEDLFGSKKPFVLQSYLRDDGSKMKGTVRFAVIHPDHTVPRSNETVEHIKAGRNYDEWELIDEDGLTTNHELPMGDYTKPLKNEIQYKEAKYMELSDSRDILELYKGITEFKDLLRGRPGSDSLYGEHDLFGFMPVKDIELPHFGSFIPRYYDRSPWRDIPYREPPETYVGDVIRNPAGRDISLGKDVDALLDDADRDDRSILEGSDGHDALVNWAVRILQLTFDEDVTVEKVEQADGETNPDFRVEFPDRTVGGEAEYENAPKKALFNYREALAADYQAVWFVAKSASKADRIRRKFLRPWNERATDIDDGVVLLTTDRKMSLPTGQTAVLPADESASRWVLAGDELRLVTTEGEQLAAGPAGGTRDEWTVETPRLDTSGTTDRVVDVDGQTLAEGPDVEAYTPVYEPFLPDDLWLNEDMQLYYQDGDELTSASLVADWGNADSKSEIYDEGLEEIVETYLVTDDDASMLYEDFQERVQEYFDLRATETPPKNWIGRRIEGVEIDDPGAETREIHARWRFEPGLSLPAWMDGGPSADGA
ncbi:MAG: hypothetical protein ABEJ44_00505, partial [Halanaeroarchaeum sp.]